MDMLTSAGTLGLRDLFSREGPVASVYFDPRGTDEEDALPRWREIADALERQGVASATLQELEGRLLGAVPGPGVRAAFAVGDEIALTVDMLDSEQPDLAVRGGLPHVLPLLAWLQGRPAYVMAVVDRTGADVTAYPGGTSSPVRGTVTGPDDEIERNAPGGWQGLTQGRYQHRAEDSWEHNAARVAHVLTRTLHHYDAHLLFLAGDVRALQYLERHLPSPVTHDVVIRRVSGGRSPDGSWQRRAEEVADDVRLAVAAETSALLADLDEERRPGGRAVEGVGPTLDALALGRVRVLLLTPETGAPRTAWYGPGAPEVAADRETLERAGVRPSAGRLVDVAVRGAALTRADVHVVPPGTAGAPAEGIGALCRY